jgi:hypothetical protein
MAWMNGIWKLPQTVCRHGTRPCTGAYLHSTFPKRDEIVTGKALSRIGESKYAVQ